MALASPEAYKPNLDGAKCEQLRHQFIGNFQGISKLERLLDDREAELSEQVTLQDNKANERSNDNRSGG